MMRWFLRVNEAVSRWLDRLLPASWRTDGNRHFRESVIPSELTPGMLVYDLGAGSRPSIPLDVKQQLGIYVVGVDISSEELRAAPVGAYDKTIVADLCAAIGPADGDLVLCQATLEHVSDTAGAIRGLSSFSRPGGRIAIFVPCRNAPFAVLNRLLPESWKQSLLFTLFPGKATGHDGFPAFYDRCTPAEFEELGGVNGLRIIWKRAFWTSSYFYIFIPAFLLWRLTQVVRRILQGDATCETFAIVWRRER